MKDGGSNISELGFDELLKLAESGDVEAQYKLALLVNSNVKRKSIARWHIVMSKLKIGEILEKENQIPSLPLKNCNGRQKFSNANRYFNQLGGKTPNGNCKVLELGKYFQYLLSSFFFRYNYNKKSSM